MCLFSLTSKELMSLNINIADAPHWVRMLIAFRGVAASHSGLYDLVPVFYIPLYIIHLFLSLSVFRVA